MTRTQMTAYGVVPPPPLHHSMQAVLLLCVSLVQGVATTLGMIFKRRRRDWHTARAREALPQAKPDNLNKDRTTPTESFSGASRESLLAHRGNSKMNPANAINRHARDMREHDPIIAPITVPCVRANGRTARTLRDQRLT